MPEQDLDELNDSNSFLSQAINSAVKDLEHSVVDPDWFLQNDPAPPYPTTPSIQGVNTNTNTNLGTATGIQQQNQVFQKPLPPQSLTSSSMSSTSQPSTSNVIQANTSVLIPSPFPSPSSILSSSSTNTAKQIDKIEGGSNKFQTKDSIDDFEIVEQLLNEQQQFSDEVDSNETVSMRDNIEPQQQSAVSNIEENRLNDQENISLNDPNENIQQNQETITVPQTTSTTRKNHDSSLKYRDASSSIKRFDPKFRALTEAFRLKTEEDAKAAAIAAESETDTNRAVDDASAPSTQDSGIMSQESSQPDSINDSQVTEAKLYKYMSVPASTSAPIQNHSPSIIESRQTHASNIHPMTNANAEVLSMSDSSELAGPIVNNDRYPPYQNTDLLRQTTSQHVSSQWNEMSKHERSASVPNHSLPHPNYNCYINQGNNGGSNRDSNLSIFVGHGTPPPQHQTMHSPSFVSCAQQNQLQSDCMQQQATVGAMNPIQQHCRSVHTSVGQTPIQRHPHNDHQPHQVNQQQHMVQTPTHPSGVGLIENNGTEVKPWTRQIELNSRNQQLPSNQHQDGSHQQSYSDITDPNNPFAMSEYQPLMVNQEETGLMVPPQNLINSNEFQAQQHSLNLKGSKTSVVSPSHAVNPPDLNTYQQTSQVHHSSHHTPTNSNFFDTNNQNKEVLYQNETGKPYKCGDTDATDYKPSTKIVATECQNEDPSVDPCFSGKIGKKKLASKHKLYSEKIKRSKSSSSHHLPYQQQPGEEKHQLPPFLIRSSESVTKSSTQNQHIKKAKLLASSEHRKHVEHKINLVKISTKGEDKLSQEDNSVQDIPPNLSQPIKSQMLEPLSSDSSSVPLSYETEVEVTTQESNIIAVASPGNLEYEDEDDNILQEDNDHDSLAIDGDSNSEATVGSIPAPYQVNDCMEPTFTVRTEMKAPHKKRLHTMQKDPTTSSKSTTEKEPFKGGIKSCDVCPYSSKSAVS